MDKEMFFSSIVSDAAAEIIYTAGTTSVPGTWTPGSHIPTTGSARVSW